MSGRQTRASPYPVRRQAATDRMVAHACRAPSILGGREFGRLRAGVLRRPGASHGAGRKSPRQPHADRLARGSRDRRITRRFQDETFEATVVFVPFAVGSIVLLWL